MVQPWLHDLNLTLAAPTQVWSNQDGQIRRGGLGGVYHGDRRLLSELVVRLDGQEPAPVATQPSGGDRCTFVAVPRHLGDLGPDPTVRLVRRREVEPGLVRETFTLSSTAATPVTCRLELLVAADLASLDDVKAGGAPERASRPEGVGGPVLTWEHERYRGTLRAHRADTATATDDDAVAVTWPVTVAPGESETRELLLVLDDPDAAVTPPSRHAGWGALAVDSADRRLGPVVARALDDLRLLRLTTPGSEDEFVAAGAPWFLTLFGRDSLWTSRMLMPVSTDLAGSTLRLLARHQGTGIDRETAEEPGKILHEVRSTGFTVESSPDPSVPDRRLPAIYFGTIDATPLWALTLHDAWSWGLEPDRVEELLPALERALTWQVEHGDADGDTLLEYVDHSGRGLSNQGWKDSGDAVRRGDGSLAQAPIALCEVQGYAYAAAVRGADLLETFGRSGTDRWREWAARLRDEFRRRFWVEDAHGCFPAIAVDAHKRPVVSLTSNIGHLLGTGLLDEDEVDAVARRLVAPDMLSGFGVRTMSRAAAGYSPTGYHVGSVWPHDTAICLAGLAAEGRPETGVLAEALLSALDAFDGRPPELFSGDARSDHPTPLPYPAACRPQAWSAASAVSLVSSLTGLRPGATPKEAPTLDPVRPWSFGATAVAGLRSGAGDVRLDVGADGTGTVQVG